MPGFGNIMANPSMRCPTPFAFPFNPLGLSLFDTDPSRILTILHHQTILAEEALRYRGLILSPKDPMRYNPLVEILSKEQEFLLKRTNLFKNNFRHPFNLHDFMSTIPSKETAIAGGVTEEPVSMVTATSAAAVASKSQPTSVRGPYDDTVHQLQHHHHHLNQQPHHHQNHHHHHHHHPHHNQHLKSSKNDNDNDDANAGGIESLGHRSASRSPSATASSNITTTDMPLSKHAGPYFKEGHRYNPMATSNCSGMAATETATAYTGAKSPSASSSESSSPTPLIKPVAESLLLQDTIEEETKCVVCNATFPSVWLLEQHAALQHANLGPMEEKPFICDQCGQSYRYRSAYVKHREQNHRARLPADKLFTCDVCGMQFRYLKSFKKHRLNHALERLHGKNERRTAAESGSELVSSSNEALTGTDDIGELHFTIKTEDEEDDQDDTIDSPGAVCADPHQLAAGIRGGAVGPTEDVHPKISSSELQEAASGLNALNNNDARNFILKQPRFMHNHESESNMPSTSTINNLINAERIPSEQALGLNPQEASILNFLRVDAAEKQRDRSNFHSRFACPFCGKCVRSKENLKLHVRKHTGERPFVCLFCGRAFGGKSDLTRHLRIHTGERPYHCEACGKCFARADYLSKHLTTHVHNSPR